MTNSTKDNYRQCLTKYLQLRLKKHLFVDRGFSLNIGLIDNTDKDSCNISHFLIEKVALASLHILMQVNLGPKKTLNLLAANGVCGVLIYFKAFFLCFSGSYP